MMSSERVSEGYKQTKVGVIPKDWSKYELKDLIEITSKKFNPKNSNEEKKCIELEHLSQQTGKLLGFTNSKKQESTKNVFEKDNVLFGKLRPYLKKYWKADFDGVCSSEIWVLNGKKLDNDFLFQFIQTNKFNQIANVSSGSKMPRADWKYMAEVPFVVPPLKEQQKIAEILTTWDNAISCHVELIKAKEQLKKGLMQKLLSGEVRFSGFDEEWEEIRLGDIARRITSKNTDNSIDMVFSNSAINGIVIQNEFFDKDIANRDNLTGYYIVKSDDFVYNPRISKHAPSGPINRNKYEFLGIVSPIYTVFHINNNEIIDYFEYFFSSTFWFRYMKAIANYGARHDRMNIINSNFMKMPIPYPSKQEQKKIAQALSTADKDIELLKNELKSLKEQKKGLMQKLLTGEVRVKV